MGKRETKKERLERFRSLLSAKDGDVRRAVLSFLGIPSISELARRLKTRRSDVDLCVSFYREQNGKVRIYPDIRRKLEDLMRIPVGSWGEIQEWVGL